MSEYIPRILSSKIKEAAKYFPVIVVTGPRQSGKTSLCRHLYPDYKYVNLENITVRANASEDPTLFLDSLGENVIIDEVQHVPELLSMIQVRVDENKQLRYVLTGSSNFSLLRSVTQSLAGRAALFTLLPFSFKEMPKEQVEKPISELMWRGEYPRVIADGFTPYDYYQNYYNTYVERDLRDLLKLRNILSFDKFVRLLAIRVGSEFNASALAREVGVSSNTISEWLSLLATSYIAYPLQPYFSNLSKRLTKMPKVYFYDTGLLCYLLGIEDYEQLESHPLRGSIFENLAMGELLKSRYNIGREPKLYFYREQSGMEVDAVMMEGTSLHLYEMKAGKTLRPDFLENMNTLKNKVEDISASTVIYDGESFPPTSINIRDI
ncbi:MAG: ATP-binding protein [Muribaculaceae bacterium]|nr:ATP-binding protein [Muribaculaceae bacterium]